MPMAAVRWVLPTPGLLTSSTFSARSMNLSVASSSTRALGTLGWKSRSKSARPFTYGKPEERMRCRTILASRAATSTRVISSSAEQKSRSPAATIRT